MNTQAVKETTRITNREFQAVFDVLPRGRAHRKTSGQLCKVLEERGICLSSRRLREIVRRLRLDHNVVVVGIPGDGYWIAINEGEFNEGLAYFARMAREHVTTHNALKRAWFEQPLRGGEQLQLYGNGNGKKSVPIQTPEGVAKLPGGLELTRSNKASGLTEEQAITSAVLYWEVGLIFIQVAIRLTQQFDKKIPVSRVKRFWDKLDLPRRSRGGWGAHHDKSKLEVCIRRIKAHFAESGNEQKEDENETA